MEFDSDGTFSKVLKDVIYREDVQYYIHAQMTKVNDAKFEEIRVTLLELDTNDYFPQYS